MSDKPDRQTQAVAEAIFRVESGDKATWFGQPEYAKELYFEQAEAAITASDAKYVPMLVEALKEIMEFGKKDVSMRGEHYTWIVDKALSQLPEDLR